MPTEIQKHGEGFYSITRIHSAGHRTPGGQMLAGTDTIIFPFQRPGDMAGYNLDPRDVLSVLVMHLEENHPAAADKLRDAADILSGDKQESAPTGDAPKRRGRKPKEAMPPPTAPAVVTVVGGEDDEDDEEGGNE
jgi:hypothetical protein